MNEKLALNGQGPFILFFLFEFLTASLRRHTHIVFPSSCMGYSRLDSRARPKDLLLAVSGSKLSHRYVEQIFDTNLNITRQLDFYSKYEKSTLVFFIAKPETLKFCNKKTMADR